jgi:hypothetical protein
VRDWQQILVFVAMVVPLAVLATWGLIQWQFVGERAIERVRARGFEFGTRRTEGPLGLDINGLEPQAFPFSAMV